MSCVTQFKEEVLFCLKNGGVAVIESGPDTLLLETCLEWNNQDSGHDGQKMNILYACKTVKELEKVKKDYEILSAAKSHKGPQICFTSHEDIFTMAFRPDVEQFKNAILILDSAHYIEEECQNFASSSLTFCSAKVSIDSFKEEFGAINEYLPILKKFENVMKIFKAIGSPFLSNLSNLEYPALSGEDILFWLGDTKLQDSEVELTSHVNAISKFINHIFVFSEDDITESFKLYQTEGSSDGSHTGYCQGTGCRTVHFVCLNPSVIIKKVLSKNPHLLILNSETLSPFNTLKVELNIPEAIEIQNQRVIEDHQIFATILTCGAGGYFLNSSNHQGSKFDDDYLVSLGKSLVEIVKVTPMGHGVMVYATSDELLKKLKETLLLTVVDGKKLWSLISDFKDIYEVPNKQSFKTSKNSLTFAVANEHILEDMEIDMDSRRVIVVLGAPTLATNDPKFQLRLKFNTGRFEDKGKSAQLNFRLSAREKYKAIRRVMDLQIRSQFDYGVVILCDDRFDRNLLSPWVREKIEREKRIFEVLDKLKDFFKCTPGRIDALSKDPSQPLKFKATSWEGAKLKRDVAKLERDNEYLRTSLNKEEEKIKMLILEEKSLEKQLKDLRASNEQRDRISPLDSVSPLKSALPLRKRLLELRTPKEEESSHLVSLSPAESPRKKQYSE